MPATETTAPAKLHSLRLSYRQMPARGAARVEEVRIGRWALGKLLTFPNDGVRFFGQLRDDTRNNDFAPFSEDYFDKAAFERALAAQIDAVW